MSFMEFIKEFDEINGVVLKLSKTVEYMTFEEKYRETTIKVIGESACQSGNVKEVDLSKTKITELKDNCFLWCYSLQNIVLPNSLEYIRFSSLGFCNMTELLLPSSLKYFDSAAVNQASNINSIEITNNNYYYSENGFLFDHDKTQLIFVPRNTTNISDIPYIDSISSILGYAFTFTNIRCVNLSSNINNLMSHSFHVMRQTDIIDLRRTNIKTIPSYCFQTNDLKVLYLPNALDTLESNSFDKMFKLELVVLFANVSSIGENAFSDCKSLKRIIYFGTNSFETINMFDVNRKICVQVTDDYPSDKFGGLQVNRDWYRKEPITCHKKQYKVSNYTIVYLFIIFASL